MQERGVEVFDVLVTHPAGVVNQDVELAKGFDRHVDQLPATVIRGQVAAVADHVQAFGQLDILIHNAGWVGYQNIADLDVAFLQRAMDINLYAPLWLCKHAWPHLLQSCAPRIILTTSDRALYAQYEQTGLVAYSAGKMAQLGIMNALSHEGAQAGIRVNAISPVAKTRMWGVTEAPDELKPEWVTPGVLFLASAQCEDTGYVLRASNGQFTATRFTENPGVDYPRDLARIKAGTAQEVAAAWDSIKQALPLT